MTENHLCVLFDRQSDRILYADKEGDEVNNKTTESAKVRVQSGLREQHNLPILKVLGPERQNSGGPFHGAVHT